MNKLFLTNINRYGVVISLLALAMGFLTLTSGVPIFGSVSVCLGGLIGLFALFGSEGIMNAFQKPQKFFSTFVFGYLAAAILAALMSTIVQYVLHAPTAPNKVIDQLSLTFLLQTLPMLLGEELLTMVILIIIANLMGGTKKAVLIGVTISTLVFALLHLPTYDWNILQCLLIIGAARIPFTLATLRSNSIWAGYAVHVAYDWTAFLLIMFVS